MKKMPIQTHLVDFITWVICRSLKNIAVDDFEGSRAWWSDSDRLLYLIGTFGPGSFQKHPLLLFPGTRGQAWRDEPLADCNSGCGSPKYSGNSLAPITAFCFLTSTSHSLIVPPPQSHLYPRNSCG